MRRTYDGMGDPAWGAGRGGAGRGTAIAAGDANRSGSHSTAAMASAVASRRPVRRSAVGILTLIPGAELSGLERTPPRFVLAIPAHRRLERGREWMPGRPAEPADLGRVHRIPAIVPGAVGHRADEPFRPAGQAEDVVREDNVLHLVPAPDVVHLAVPTTTQDEVDTRAVVQHVDPVADVAPIAVQ